MQALWMILASLLLAAMGVCIKFAAVYYSTYELLFWRGLFGMALMAYLCRSQGVKIRTPVPMLHVGRSAVGVISLLAWFYAIAHLPLAMAVTLNYMSSVWVAVFLVASTLALGRFQEATRQGPFLLAVLTAFAGVVLMLRPTLEQNQLFAGLIGLISGIGAAMAYMQVSALGKAGEPETRTVFYFSVGTLITGGVFSLFHGLSPWNSEQAFWLPTIGVLAALGQLALTKAYNRGATLLVANLHYSGIVFAVLFGLVFFGDQITALGCLGMLLILVSGMVSTFLRQRLLVRPPADES